jgi:hypothetical protein
MDRTALEEAVARASSRSGESRRRRDDMGRFAAVVAGLAGAVGAALADTVRRPRPLRLLAISLATLTAGGLGLMAAYAISPDEEVTLVGANGKTLSIATITGPGGTTTVAVTKTKEGKIKYVPVRVLRTIAEDGSTRTVALQVTGPALTVTNGHTVTGPTKTTMVTNTLTNTQTSTLVVTDVQTVTQTDTVVVPVTETVTQNQTVVDTVTVVVTETVTVTVPPPP